MSVKMVTVKALNGASATFDSKGNYIKFTNHVASVTEAQAKELVARPLNQYVLFDGKTGLLAKTVEPSIENLELEFNQLFNSNKNLPSLKKWLAEKMNIVEPALLSFQIDRSAPMVEGQQQVVNQALPVQQSNEVVEINVDTTGDDLDSISVDGIVDDKSSTLSRAEQVLKEANEIK